MFAFLFWLGINYSFMYNVLLVKENYENTFCFIKATAICIIFLRDFSEEHYEEMEIICQKNLPQLVYNLELLLQKK